MILIDIKSYLLEHKRVSLIDLAYHFEVTPETMKGMLMHWTRKGKVRQLAGQICQKGCCQRPANLLEIYEWIES